MKAAVILVAITFLATTGYALAQETPVEKPTGKQDELNTRVDKIIKKLGSKDYWEREAATEELKKIGKPAVPCCGN